MVEVAVSTVEIAALESDIKNLQARCGTQPAHLTRQALEKMLSKLEGWCLRPRLREDEEGEINLYGTKD